MDTGRLVPGANARVSLRDVARVFFKHDQSGQVTQMRGLPLDNHLANVAKLAALWDFRRAFDGDVPTTSEDRHNWLVRAASRHDLGKPRRFRIVADKKRDGRFTYSFAGHRFEVEDDHPYVQQLIRLHHSFSVSDITEAQASLRLDWVRMPEVAVAAQFFPLDLYALEMCDQLEAEATTHAFDAPDEQQRVFMEFQVYRSTAVHESAKRLHVFPYPFQWNEPDEVRLAFESFVVHVPPEAALDGETLKDLLLHGKAEQEKAQEVVLCPLL